MEGKIGLVGYLGYNTEDPIIGGQMSKTRGIYSELVKTYGQDSVEIVDTSNWKAERTALIKRCWKIARSCSTVIIMPNRNGIKVILPFFAFLKSFMKYRLAYPVVGGWLPELLKNKLLAKSIKKVDFVLPETYELKDELEEYVSCQMEVMPIFSTRERVPLDKINFCVSKPYAFCTFSRVIPEKGIDDAIYAIVTANQNAGEQICTLDIWGPIGNGYEDHYNQLFTQYSNCITYKGVLNSDSGLEKLATYFMLLFPTYYFGEGFPTTIVEAFMAGLPVIASDWRFNKELVENDVGIIVKAKDRAGLVDAITYAVTHNDMIIIMKENAWTKSLAYLPAESMKPLYIWLDKGLKD